MKYLTNNQLRLLKLSKQPNFDCVNLSSSDIKDIKFLEDEGYVDTLYEPSVSISSGRPVRTNGSLISLTISGRGEAALIENTIEHKHNKISFIFSVVSILLSLAAIVISLLPYLL